MGSLNWKFIVKIILTLVFIIIAIIGIVIYSSRTPTQVNNSSSTPDSKVVPQNPVENTPPPRVMLPSRTFNESAGHLNASKLPFKTQLYLKENSKYELQVTANGWYFVELMKPGYWKATSNNVKGCCRNDSAYYAFDVNSGESGNYTLTIDAPDLPKNQTKASWAYFSVDRRSSIT